MVYLDAIVDTDMMPVFNGTPDRVREYLIANADGLDKSSLMVVQGADLKIVSIQNYLNRSEYNRLKAEILREEQKVMRSAQELL